MHVHFVIHEAFEAPGAIEAWAQARRHTVTRSRVDLGEALPTSVDGIDLLVVMGGPQSPTTSQAECPHFHAAAECDLIRRCVAAGKGVLGVCLGAQLIGTALGAAHAHSPEKEIGKFPITLTAAGRAHPLLAGFPATLEVGHWHGDMPGLPPGAQVLAHSEGCPRQIIAFGERVFGFQCRLELTPEVVALLIDASQADLNALRGSRFVQTPAELRAHDWAAMNAVLAGFMDKLAERLPRSGGLRGQPVSR